MTALRRIPAWLWPCLGIAAFAIAIFLRAWVSEDAYITLRVIDNFSQGYGLRWNIAERVQVYTHPLWMLLHLPLNALWKNLFHVNIALSVYCSVAALVLVLRSKDAHPLSFFGLFLLPLFLSKSFMDYTSSGLETPLCYLTFAYFGYVILRLREHRFFWFYCSLAVALSLVNRLDTAIIYAPVMCVLLWNDRKNLRWGQMILGGLPLACWLAFALFYYGFLFPNTKYAKLDTELELALYLRQSFNYVKYLFILDLPGFFILCSSVWFILRREAMAASIALGVYFYALYILVIGGDYMAGRFWAFPIFVSAWLWFTYAPRLQPDKLFAIACLLVAGHVVSPMLRDINKDCDSCIELKGRIIDASRTFRLNKLVASTFPLEIRQQGRYTFFKEGLKLANSKEQAKVMFYVGMQPYYAGPQFHAIDMLGLGDPLLARLPATLRRNFYIGHFRRPIPAGYEHMIETGSDEWMYPPLANYYEKLRLITSGDLLDGNRLKTILEFNLGTYDHWKYDYLTP